MSPSRAEGPATACAVREPLNLEQLPGQLTFENNRSLITRQAAHLSKRFGLTASCARVVAGLAFERGSA